jgi:methylmalonyl-CoA/ethylmalonyl-CoA epimerase
MNFPCINFFGHDSHFHHIGYAVRRIADVAPDSQIFEDPIQRVRVAFEELHGVLVEFVEPIDVDSPINNYLEHRQSIYHICIEVADLSSSIDHARGEGMFLLRRPKPAVAFGGRNIAWVTHPHLGLFELLQR